jgi:tetratricopeptide (TPR) repeat protein
MATVRFTTSAIETWKWVALVIGAMAVALFLAVRTVGAAPTASNELPPALLLPEVTAPAVPMDHAAPSAALATQVRGILQLHRTGELEAAVDAWAKVELPYKVDFWRNVARSEALLELGRWDEAAPLLANAEEQAPDHAVVHYYLGLLRLEQAARAGEWNDAEGPSNIRLAAYPPMVILPLPRSMYELMAMEELETALELSGNIAWNEVLVPANPAEDPAAMVRVADLLEVLGAKELTATAHNVLGMLCLEHGQADRAEAHLLGAVAAGANVGDGFRMLGRLYEAEGRPMDAAHAYVLAIKNGDGFMLPAQKVLENLWHGMGNGN